MCSSKTFRLRIFVRFLLGLVVFMFDEVHCRTSDILKVELQDGGILVGRHLTSHNGRHVRAFMGIPYAEPPVGELRFKPPVPKAPWTGEKLVVRDSPICIQRDPFRRDQLIEGSEDCLYLNVYIPEKPRKSGPLPVMIFFHGGGWECGSGISAFYGPDFLMDHDVVYVSGNFRLGPLGFLSTETTDCPGNNGLKDQLLILKWVQNNIAAFGGNPNLVTIFGESAGGASVTYHMMSEKSKGLFHKGISQSGTYFNPWAQPAHKGVAASRAKRLAKMLDCDKPNWSETLNCLRKKSASDITATVYEFFEWDYDPMIPFPPVVEPDSPDAFLTALPRTEKLPHGFKLPWMAGATSEEGALKTAGLLNIPGLLDEFKQKFYEVLPIILNYDHHSKDVQRQITDRIDKFYFNGLHDYEKKNHQNLTNLITDGWFTAGLDEYLRLRVDALSKDKTSVGPTYVYLFDHKGAASFTEIFEGGKEDYYGVCHAEELQYLFPIGKELFVTSSPTNEDLQIREALQTMWVNFAWHSDPTPASSDLPKWNPTKTYPVDFVRIGNQDHENWQLLSFEKGLLQERVDFWNDLKPHIPANLFKDEL
ncbi:venom carboxylesterase-6 [Eupeodes corollae]|uniref:venom carboxylesterase-6 n=1 Tax=Eupeodes corollae TaxID=290404 RepID=UPI00248FF406|nr:venom carboxylesterase-6 [Eupeodes corollae]